ncbi:MAG: hypothetical protein KC643_27460 [Nitrospira sp.]|nr:hypothetical protein [Nitrospira sp.]
MIRHIKETLGMRENRVRVYSWEEIYSNPIVYWVLLILNCMAGFMGMVFNFENAWLASFCIGLLGIVMGKSLARNNKLKVIEREVPKLSP